MKLFTTLLQQLEQLNENLESLLLREEQVTLSEGYEFDSNQISSELQYYGIQEDKELIDYINRYDFMDKIVPSNYESIKDFEHDITKAQLKIKCNKKIPQIKLNKLRQAYRELEFIGKEK